MALAGGTLLGADTAANRKEAALSSAELSTLVRKSVVVIKCSTPDGSTALGSGFYVATSGFIATNAHVVSDCSDILIRDEGSDEPKLARALLLDEDRDIAIVSVQRTTRAALTLASSALVQQGQRVYAVGHPEGLEYTVSEGIVSAFRDLSGTRLIQTTAPISPGSSGGPLVNSRGQVVGMTTLFLKVGQNLNFAVPADAIRDALTNAKRHAASGQRTPAMSPATAARIARSLRERKDFESARKILSAALKESPSRLDLLLEAAELALGENRLTDAEFFIHALFDSDSLNRIYELRGERKLSLFQRRREAQDDFPWSKAELAEWMKGLDEAERIVRKMLGIDPNFAPAHQVLGFVLTSKSYLVSPARYRDEGCRELRLCLDLNPDAAYAIYRAKANALLFVCSWRDMSDGHGPTPTKDQWRSSPALRYLEAAVQWAGNGDNWVLYTEYAIVLSWSGQIAKANAAAKHALALPSVGSDARDYLKEMGLPRKQVLVVSHAQTQEGKSLSMPIVTGIVRNEGDEVVSFTRVIVECKNPRGAIVGTGTAFVEPRSLQPGESGSFEILLKGPMQSECDINSRIAESD